MIDEKTQKPNKPTRKLSEEKRRNQRYLKAIAKKWKGSAPKIIETINETVLSDENHVVEKMEMLILAERYLQFYSKQLWVTNSDKYDILHDWFTRSKIQHMSQVYFWMEKRNIEKKYWLTEKLKLGFFENILAQRIHFLENGFPEATNAKAQIEIRGSLTNGQFPDYNKFNHQEIASILGEVLLVDYLEKEIEQIDASGTTNSSNLIIHSPIGKKDIDKPENFTDEETISIKIPIEVIKGLQKGFIKNELEKIRNIHPRPIHELKAYTRTEASELLHVSLPKLDEYTNDGKLKVSRLDGNGEKRYRWEDIQEVLVGVNTGLDQKF